MILSYKKNQEDAKTAEKHYIDAMTPCTYLCKQLSVLEVGHGLDDGSGALRWITRLEDTRPNKHSIETYKSHTKSYKENNTE